MRWLIRAYKWATEFNPDPLESMLQFLFWFAVFIGVFWFAVWASPPMK